MVEIRGTLSGTNGDDWLADNSYPTGTIYTSILAGSGNDYISSWLLGATVNIDGGEGFDIFVIPDGWYGGYEFTSTVDGIDIYYNDVLQFHVTDVEMIQIDCFQGYSYTFFADPFFDNKESDGRSAPYWVDTYYDGPYEQYEYFTKEDSFVDFNNLTDEQAGVFTISQWLGNYDAQFIYPQIYDAGSGDDTVILPEPENVALYVDPIIYNNAADRVWDYSRTFFAGSGDDTVYGSSRGDRIDGGEGFDLLLGRKGDDYISDTPFSSDGSEMMGGSIDGGVGTDTVLLQVSPDRIVNRNNTTVWAPGDGSEYINDGRNLYAEYLDAAGDVVATIAMSNVEKIVGLNANPSPARDLFNAYSNVVDFGALSEHGSAAVQALYRAGRLDQMYDALAGNDEVWLVADGTRIGKGVFWDGSKTFNAGYGNDFVHGSNAADKIDGGYGDDKLLGLGGRDTLQGAAGNDLLDGGAGIDSMSGGYGNDTYIVDNASDAIIENYQEGIDSVESSVSYTLSAYVENLTLTGSADLVGKGNGFNNILTGNRGTNKLYGSEGDDQLFGNGGVDTLLGGGGNDLLDGGPGGDIMKGGLGDDWYYVDSARDQITEGSSSGSDRIYASTTYTIGANVEELYLTGQGNTDGFGNGENNSIYGNEGDNNIQGGAGDDHINAGGGNDYLVGGLGYDSLFGGEGDDTYFIQDWDALYEGENAGIDHVISLIEYGLPGGFENLTLKGSDNINGTGNELDNVIVGNRGNNILDGWFGADTMVGGRGDDTYYVRDSGDSVIEELASGGGTDIVYSSVSFRLGDNVENLALFDTAANATGNAIDNVITGNDYDNRLNGMEGADTMVGGHGNDTYYVDNVGDVVDESTSWGHDTVRSSVNFTLGINLEDLVLTGNDAIDGFGNDWDNTITGNNSNNFIDGGVGVDTMIGGRGDDTYVVDHVYDNLIEKTGQGIDIVIASFDYSLGRNLDVLVLTGAATTGYGNILANGLYGTERGNFLYGRSGNDFINGFGGNDRINGGSGSDTIVGGAGKDSVTGGRAADVFVFRDGDMAGRRWDVADRITDFSQSDGDRIRLSGIDGNTDVDGMQDMTFIGGMAFSHTAGELRYEIADGHTMIYGDTDGDGVADFAIGLDGEHQLASGDFLL